MTVTSVAARLASDGLRQHLYARPTAVAEACLRQGYSCTSSAECCQGLWCNWRFTCVRV